ncbi:MAG: hypothetical protein Q4E75_03685 [bacterium]|nr:hypothetical protein [bacterium]
MEPEQYSNKILALGSEDSNFKIYPFLNESVFVIEYCGELTSKSDLEYSFVRIGKDDASYEILDNFFKNNNISNYKMLKSDRKDIQDRHNVVTITKDNSENYCILIIVREKMKENAVIISEKNKEAYTNIAKLFNTFKQTSVGIEYISIDNGKASLEY